MKKKPIKKAKVEKPEESLKLNLGCGLLRREGYKGCDIYRTPTTDYVFDARKAPWPFKNESVSDIFMSHFFEHFDGEERAAIMKECYRVLKMGGKIELVSPHWSSMRSIQDPTHKWPPLGESSFAYHNQQWCRLNGVAHAGAEDGQYNFDFVYGHGLAQEWQSRPDETKQFAVKHYLNVAEDIRVVLTKIALLPPRTTPVIRNIDKDGILSDWQEVKK